MSGLVSRILLAIFVIPSAAVVYLTSCVAFGRHSPIRETALFTLSGLITWAFVGVYWVLLWSDTVRWTRSRLFWTAVAILGSFVVAGFLGTVFAQVQEGFGVFLGSIAAPLSWLIWVTILWKETARERAERLRSLGSTALVCPACGYNLTGLQGTRCPECGKLYTLDEIVAGQPSRAMAEISD